ncbi:hypothetical protein PR048_014126 [Dryococelus australis]|uniref:Uncharacterized protein n=1 Tax=Dryococelus australis TaxID=614101 RepID=A0ABQ9HDI4_9NEOP|nr:hypothetical protein PR048_014126 [Dryococelus australis]
MRGRGERDIPDKNPLTSGIDKIDVKHVYTEVTFAIGSQFIRHALDYSEPIADLQGNKIPAKGDMSVNMWYVRFTYCPQGGSVVHALTQYEVPLPRIFACGNHPFPPPTHSSATLYSPRITHIGSQDLDRLACPPPTKATQVQTPAGSIRIFACGDDAVGRGVSRGSPVFPVISFRRRRSILTSIALIGSQDLGQGGPSMSAALHASGGLPASRRRVTRGRYGRRPRPPADPGSRDLSPPDRTPHTGHACIEPACV